MYKQPRVSILVPYHDMKNAEFFLKRNIDSIMSQTFTDYEIVLTKDGSMAENTNAGIKRARGELIKIMYLDDYFLHQLSLQQIVEAFDSEVDWMMVGTYDNTEPCFTHDIETGNNRLDTKVGLTGFHGISELTQKMPKD